MPKLVEWDKCCGCAACANKCAKQAIAMLPNEEGFLHPVVDEAKCVECGKCEKACPALSVANNAQTNTTWWSGVRCCDDGRPDGKA